MIRNWRLFPSNYLQQGLRISEKFLLIGLYDIFKIQSFTKYDNIYTLYLSADCEFEVTIVDDGNGITITECG